ncbi:MAG: malonyl-CoA synthase [Mesorhizobium sp.]|nr:malonyl-CoA synthase [Mesorhizobium sp.]MCO5162712.1 malonyl-CoA synthase [Mesorhizobium sp.]
MSLKLFNRLRNGAAGADNPFLTLLDGSVLTYADLIYRSGKAANLLMRLGVTKGDRVAVQTEKSVEVIILYVACLRLGAVYLPLNSAYTASEVTYFLEDAEPRLFVCTPERAAELEPVARAARVEHVLHLDADGRGSLSEAIDAAPDGFEESALDDGDPAAILYTSGTTGRSKGAVLTRGNIASNAESLAELWHFSAADVLLHALPIFHTHGLFVAINTTLVAGSALLFLPRFDLEVILDGLERSTVLMGVPTFYTRLLGSAKFTRERVAHMRLFVSGSAPLSAETHREFFDRTGHAILERYGMTETNMNTSNPYEGERRPGTVGFPLPGVDLRIADPTTGAPLPQGEIGSIEVKGANVFRGYWNNPEKTKAEFRDDGYFITGDMGFVDAEGYVSIVGRSKDLVISGGYNVYPAEVEAAIDALPGVAESAIIGLPHPDLGEGVTAVVVARPSAVLDERTIVAELSRSLARYKVPRHVILTENLPRNAMGKVQKAALREVYAGLYGAAAKTSKDLP